MTASSPSSASRATPLELVFMGTPAFAAVCLERLLVTRHTIKAVVTQPDKPRGRGRRLQPGEVKSLALARGIPVLQPTAPKDPSFVSALTRLAPDLGVVVAYGRILPRAVLEIPRFGCINAHASLLPALRGAAPIERAILQGCKRTGVTIMKINERMDAGDILAARSVDVAPDATGGSLRQTLSEVAADLLVEAVEEIAAGRAVFTPQQESLATYAPPLDRGETRIDWSQPCEIVERTVRAFLPSPGAYTCDGELRLKILRAHCGDARGEPGMVVCAGAAGIEVACGRGSLVVTEVQPAGRRPMRAADYLRGYHGGRPPARLHATDG